jgi:threonyl-tRNA synthetase
MQKIPYILVVGEKESSDDTVAVNARDNKPADVKAMVSKQEIIKVEEFMEKIRKEIKEKL